MKKEKILNIKYYSADVIFMKLTGLWPYQKILTKIFRRVIFYGFIISVFIPMVINA